MGLIKLLERKKQEPNPLKRVFNTQKSQDKDLEERMSIARRHAYEKESIHQARIKGKQQARKPQSGFGLKGFTQGAIGVAREIGSLAPQGRGIFDLPPNRGSPKTLGYSSMFDFGMPRTASPQPKKKHKGKKLTIYIK